VWHMVTKHTDKILVVEPQVYRSMKDIGVNGKLIISWILQK